MQELSSEPKKRPPKNYQIRPKNYHLIDLPPKKVEFTPVTFLESR
ncbi:hypothetical protein SAMN05444349_11398 [Bacteroides faecichinchillae]|uniref:Uncharacterized protein n=1 Tax=Bacteroides faecichinchillae TaxID=871325 RepID=A0A1M4ZVE5_9BACE|nr:hypothetical protein SAMN05444349_11398 [Bacteroides faecichinchillae]